MQLRSLPLFSESKRGVPAFLSFTGGQKEFCLLLLREEKVELPLPTDPYRTEMNSLIKNGTLTDEMGVAKFRSPIIEYIATYRLQRSKATMNAATLEELIIRTLCALRASVLRRSFGRGTDGKLLERTWQMEFYRAATMQISDDVCISPDVRHMFGTKGMVDFYVNDSRKWAVEIMRESGLVEEHALRFAPEGLYAVVPIYEKAILCFTEKRSRFELLHDVWYIQCTSEFTGATVIRKDKEPEEITFTE
jgi:hypothetical protein